MVMPRSNDWRTWVQMGSNPGFDPSYLSAVSGGSPDQWTQFRNQMMSPEVGAFNRAAAEAYRQPEAVALRERQEEWDMARLRAWGKQGGGGYPPADWVPPGLGPRPAEGSSGGSGAHNASPTRFDEATASQLRAELKAKGLSDAEIETVIGEYRSGAKSADKIREELGLGGGGAAAAAATDGGGTLTGPETREGVESERGLDFEKSFKDYLSSRLPTFLAPEARTALNRRQDPLEAQFLAGQALGNVPLETTIRDFIANNF